MARNPLCSGHRCPAQYDGLDANAHRSCRSPLISRDVSFGLLMSLVWSCQESLVCVRLGHHPCPNISFVWRSASVCLLKPSCTNAGLKRELDSSSCRFQRKFEERETERFLNLIPEKARNCNFSQGESNCMNLHDVLLQNNTQLCTHWLSSQDSAGNSTSCPKHFFWMDAQARITLCMTNRTRISFVPKQALTYQYASPSLSLSN